MLADGKLARQITSRSQNPNYTFAESTEHFSLGEVAAPIIVFGDMTAGTVNRTWVEYFFGKTLLLLLSSSDCLWNSELADACFLLENERLPSSLGWSKKERPVTLINVTGVTDMIDAKTHLTTP